MDHLLFRQSLMLELFISVEVIKLFFGGIVWSLGLIPFWGNLGDGWGRLGSDDWWSSVYGTDKYLHQNTRSANLITNRSIKRKVSDRSYLKNLFATQIWKVLLAVQSLLWGENWGRVFAGNKKQEEEKIEEEGFNCEPGDLTKCEILMNLIYHTTGGENLPSSVIILTL